MKGDHVKLTRGKGDHSRSALVPGMAYFAGSGPDGQRCVECVHFNFGERPIPRLMGGQTQRCACAKFVSMTGNQEPPRFRGDAPACKYFEFLGGE